MASSGTIGSVIGIVVALGVIALLVWLLGGTKKETFKYNKGKIVFECDLTTPDPTRPVVSTGSCKIVAAPGTGGINQTFPSMSLCENKCGTYWGCQQSIGPGVGLCENVGNNCTGAYKNTQKECDDVCNKYDPAPTPNVSSGRYLIQSTLNGQEGLQNRAAYLVTRMETDPTTGNLTVVAFIDPTATTATADVWTFDQSVGTLNTNKLYNVSGYAFNGQALYLAVTTPDPPAKDQPGNSIILQPLTGGPYSVYTLGWFLSMDPINAGRIATPWHIDAYDYLCVGSIYPTVDPQLQPAVGCRLNNSSYGLKFIPVK